MEVNREKLAWAAGLFEGEGCFTSWSGDGKRYLQCILASTDKDVVYKFKEIVGFGSIHPEKLKVGYKQSWRFRVSSFEKCQALICMLWPWLGERRKARALEILSLYKDGGYRYGLPYNEIKKLYLDGLAQLEIATKFGCTQANISLILHKKKG